MTYEDFCIFLNKKHEAMLDIIYKQAYKGYIEYEKTCQYFKDKYGEDWEDYFEMDHGSYESELNYHLYLALEYING